MAAPVRHGPQQTDQRQLRLPAWLCNGAGAPGACQARLQDAFQACRVRLPSPRALHARTCVQQSPIEDRGRRSCCGTNAADWIRFSHVGQGAAVEGALDPWRSYWNQANPLVVGPSLIFRESRGVACPTYTCLTPLERSRTMCESLENVAGMHRRIRGDTGPCAPTLWTLCAPP